MKDNKGDNRTKSIFSPKYSIPVILLISLAYVFYTQKFICSPQLCPQNYFHTHQSIGSTRNSYLANESTLSKSDGQKIRNPDKTMLHHIVFGIASSAKLWERRKDFVKLWWKPKDMRGFVWLDKHVNKGIEENKSLPPVKISGETSKFKYTHKKGDRSAIRISRIISETVRLGMKDVRWIIMVDDDTFFVVENLVRILNKYDHTQFYYIGSTSESHIQNINFSFDMAFGGGGFAISYALAKAMEKMQDKCLERYPGLYGSDDRVQACMAEIGVPLTKEVGFHQLDLTGNVFGLLAAHPIAPLVSLHHLDSIQPIFPKSDNLQALQHLRKTMKLDSAGLIQQSICYHKAQTWTLSVSWGYAVQIYRSIIPAREMQVPLRTFLNWFKRADQFGFSFNTRPVSNKPCERPIVYMMSNAIYDPATNWTASEYVRFWGSGPKCKEDMDELDDIYRIEVYKKPDPYMWDKAPKRKCCRIWPSNTKGTLVVNVGDCGEDELIEL